MFYLDYGGQPQVMAEPQTVTVSIGSEVVDTFPVGRTGDVRRIPLTVAQLGTGDQVELRSSVDRTFVPAVVTAGASRTSANWAVRVPRVRRSPVARGPGRRGDVSGCRHAAAVLVPSLTALAWQALAGVVGGGNRVPRHRPHADGEVAPGRRRRWC